jgi:hypothetical protein
MGAHPPWLCKVFGKLPAKEREKPRIDNKLCPFCLLHDKDKLCGAKQRTVSVACMASGCKGRHAQKLHDFLKDVFREERRVESTWFKRTMSGKNRRRPGSWARRRL